MTQSVVVTLQSEDAVALQEATTSAAAQTLRLSTSTAAMGVLGAVIGGGIAMLIKESIARAFAELWLAGALVGSLVMAWAWPRWIESRVTSPPLQIGPLKISLDTDGITVSSEDFTARSRWLGLSAFHQTPTHFVMQLRDRSSLVVPARCFADQAGFESFIAAARNLHARSAAAR